MPEDQKPEQAPGEPAETPAKTESEPGASAEDRGKPEPEPSLVLRGTPVAPGLVLGVVHRKGHDLATAPSTRVARDEVERELNRFRRSLEESRRQLADLKSRIEGRVDADDARILDTHLTYLKDSVFIADVENLILGEQMALEAAIAKVVGDFDRIFRLVKSETLRQTAVDLRDVGIRVLRNLENVAATEGGGTPDEYVLVAPELSIVDMFNLSNEHVQGIVTEEGGLTSHAAIFARSMRIPTITGVDGLLEAVEEGDFVILDATEGVLRVNPDDLVRQQYSQAGSEPEAIEDDVPDWASEPARTRDGTSIRVDAMCGNLPEVEQAISYGLEAVGLYRTELLYLLDQRPPSRDALHEHYRAVVDQARGGAVTFRLLNADSGLGLEYLHDEREANPQLGRMGTRILLAREAVLRRQLQALLLAGADADLRIVLPFVTDCGELRRVKEVLFEEKLELRKSGQAFNESPKLGVVIETPASLLGLRDLVSEADFLALNLDSFVQHILAADRENADLASITAGLHPYVLRAIRDACEVASGQGRPLSVFGVTAFDPQNVPLLLGCGLRRFSIPPSALRDFREELGRTDLRDAQRRARVQARTACQEETGAGVQGFRHGFARP
jgi:phosphotransferase system enzyme I (PtsI)